MNWEPLLGTDAALPPPLAPDTSATLRPHPARVYDCWLGGKDGFAADREAAEEVARTAPWVVAGARANRAFLRRSLTFLARAGVRQYLDLGAGLPTAPSVHEVVQRFQPDARVCYVDNDPIVLAHARALLANDHRTIAVHGDIRTPDAILNDPAVRDHLDFSSPLAVLFVAVLHFIPHEDHPAALVGTFRDALPSGSHVVISHVADLPDSQAEADRAEATREAVKVYEALAAPFVLRSRDQFAALFGGFDLVEPGIVAAQDWRPRRGRSGPPVPVLAAVGCISPSAPSQRGRSGGGSDD
jgi:hypothetical protein